MLIVLNSIFSGGAFSILNVASIIMILASKSMRILKTLVYLKIERYIFSFISTVCIIIIDIILHIGWLLVLLLYAGAVCNILIIVYLLEYVLLLIMVVFICV